MLTIQYITSQQTDENNILRRCCDILKTNITQYILPGKSELFEVAVTTGRKKATA